MSGENSRVKSLWLMEETGGFATIADSSGAAALFIPAELGEDGYGRNMQATIPRNWSTGRRKRLPHVLGAKRSEMQFRAQLSGYVNTVLTAGNPPTATLNWLDILLRSVFGAASSHDASDVGAGSTTSSIVTDTNEMNAGDLICLRGPSTNGGRAMWARAQNATSPITVAPTLPAAPAEDDVSAAVRTYSPLTGANEAGSLGNTFTLIEDQDGIRYGHAGCIPTALSISAEAGQAVMLEATVAGDSRERYAFASLPNAPIDDPDPMVFLLSSVNVNGSVLDVKSVAIDFGLVIAEIVSPAHANGRAGWRVVDCQPTLRIDPLNDTDFEDLFTAGTVVQVMIKLGIGALVDSALNTIGVHFEGMQLSEHPADANDTGIMRKNLVLVPCDVAASGYQSKYMQIGVA